MTGHAHEAPAALSDAREFEHGLVIGKFYPVHAGHLQLVRAALSRCERVTVQVLASSQESIPGELRARWIRDELPQARVLVGLDDAPVDYSSPDAWDAHVAIMRDLLRREPTEGSAALPGEDRGSGSSTDPREDVVDAVFTSDAYGAELARRFDAAWVQVDPGRALVSVSGTAIRADPGTHWWALPAAVRSWFVRRVVVLGAESTGTTTLAEDLQAHYTLPRVPEFGREWSEVRPGGLAAPWHSAEFDLVAREQSRLEDAAAAVTPIPLVVCDTDALATTLWHERYVGTVSPSVVALAESRVPDLYLLTGEEIPFVQDGMRDGEHIRSDMHGAFRAVLAAQAARGGAPWVELRGSRTERTASAIALIDALCATTREIADPMPQAGVGAWSS